MVLPLYQLILLFVFFVGFAAMLKVPGLKGGDRFVAVHVVVADLRPWFVGVIGAAGVLTALVPGSMITDDRLDGACQQCRSRLLRPRGDGCERWPLASFWCRWWRWSSVVLHAEAARPSSRCC